MKNNIDAILSELGWQDGFRIPVANEENRRLEEDIDKKRKHKVSLNVRIESVEERMKMMKQHANNIAIQHNVNQKLLVAHSVQLDSEDHLYRLSNSTEWSLRQEAQQFEKEWRNINERLTILEKDLLKMTKKIEVAKKAVEYDENNLQNWEQILNYKEENKQLFEQFLKDDAKKYKELEQQRQKLSLEVETYRGAIIKAMDEVHELEIILDQTANLYREALKERERMINQWTQSVAVLRQRDNDIQNCLREIETFRTIKKDKMEVLEEVTRFANDQALNNKQLEDLIKSSEKKLLAMRNEHKRITEAVDIYEIQIRTQKRNVENIARQTQQIRANIKRKKIEIENKHIKIEDLKKRIKELQITLQKIDDQKLNIEDKTKQLEKMIEQEEKRKGKISKELRRLQAAILRTTNKITELNDEKIILNMQKQNEKKKIDLLNMAYESKQQTLEEKKETLYQVEFNIQKCEMKLARIKGQEHNKLESEKKQKTIEELESVYSKNVDLVKLLQNQIGCLERDMRKISAAYENDNRELDRLKNKKEDLVLLVDTGEKQLKAAQIRNEEKQVEENVQRLKISEMEHLMSKVEGKVYNLEKYLLELEAALQERKAEITMQNELLIVQKRIISGECSELRNAISERKGRIRQLQARYENNIVLFGQSPDGAPLTTAYLKIQNAQEKYILQEQGDKLDETIRKCEQEIQSMENTLRVINTCNDKYRNSLDTIDQSGPEHEERKKLDNDIFCLREKLKCTQIEFQRAVTCLQETRNVYTETLDNVNVAKEENDDKKQILLNLKRQVEEQLEKITRAEKSTRKARKDIEKMCICSDNNIVLLQEKDVKLRQLQERNALVLQDIAEFSIRHVEAEVYVKKLLAAKNIELPFVPQFGRLSDLSQCGSSTECTQRSTTARTSNFQSSRETIGSVINITPCLVERTCSRNSSKDVCDVKRKSVTQCKKRLSKTCP